MGTESKSLEYIVGAKKDSEGNLDIGEAAVMRVDAESAAINEKERNAQTVRDLHEVFGKMDMGKDGQHLSLLFQEQSPLIVKYLKESTEGGQGGDQYLDMASGIAMLGFEVAQSGFGRGAIDYDDPAFDKEIAETLDRRYKAATAVFDTLLQKMYPEGTNSGQVLIEQLDIPFEEASQVSFLEIKKGLSDLYEQKWSDGVVEPSQYQDSIDGLIEKVGDTLGETAELVAKSGVSGEMTNEVAENYKRDMLTLADTLKELQKLRKESIRHKYGSSAYEQLSLTQLRKIEDAERKTDSYKVVARTESAQEEKESEPSFHAELQKFDSAVLSLDLKQVKFELKRLDKVDSWDNEQLEYAANDASKCLRVIKDYKIALRFFQKEVEQGKGIDPEMKKKSLAGLERIAKSLLVDMPQAIDQVQDLEIKKAMHLMEKAATAMAKEYFPDLYKRQLES